MNRANRRWLILAIPLVGGILFIVTGLPSWTGPHESPAACLYLDKDCSLAAATWALCFVTLAAFIGAVLAALFAADAYTLETRAVLGQKRCAQREHLNEPDVTLYLPSAAAEPQRYRPLGFSKSAYRAEHHAFLNLGRGPLVDVVVGYSIGLDGATEPVEGTLDLDCIPVDGEVHATIYVSRSIARTRIMWTTPAFQGSSPLLFYPGRSNRSSGAITAVSPPSTIAKPSI